MKITLITSNQLRHNYLINSLNKICNELFIIQEEKSGSKFSTTSHKIKTTIKNIYFNNVLKAEKKVFGISKVKKVNKILKVKGNINNYNLESLKKQNTLDTKYYWLIKLLSCNVHMGLMLCCLYKVVYYHN